MSRQQSARHVLVINDTPEILELFREILEDEGYRVSLSSFSVAQMQEIRDAPPDLIILDFIIGGEALGWQMLQQLKMDRTTMEIPVIVCTAAVNLVQEIDEQLKVKQVAVVFKPFDIDDLLEVVRQRFDQAG